MKIWVNIRLKLRQLGVKIKERQSSEIKYLNPCLQHPMVQAYKVEHA